MADLQFSDSIFISRSPADVYDVVTDIARMGEWSPICKACWWDEGAGPAVGEWFTGRNEADGNVWETHCQVIAADPGREFAWTVGDTPAVRWGFAFAAADGGTTLTESWEVFPAGHAMFAQYFGEEADAELTKREGWAHSGIPQTLAAIKASVEG